MEEKEDFNGNTQVSTPCERESLGSHSFAKQTGDFVEEGKLIVNGIDFNEEKPLLEHKEQIITEEISKVNVPCAHDFATTDNTSVSPKSESEDLISEEDTRYDDHDEEKPLLSACVDNHEFDETSSNNDTTIPSTLTYGSTSRGEEGFSMTEDGTNDNQEHIKVNSVHFEDEDESLLIHDEYSSDQRESSTIILPTQESSSNSFAIETNISGASYESPKNYKAPSNDKNFFDDAIRKSDLEKRSKFSPPTRKSQEITENSSESCNKTFAHSFVHVVSTFTLLIGGYIFAVAVPGVGVVWSICGSSMSLIIGFFIPSACYLKIRSRKQLNPRSLGAWSLAIFSIISSIICTIHVLANLSTEE